MKYFSPEEIKNMSKEEMFKKTKSSSPAPFYTPDNIKTEHRLHFDWNAWTSGEVAFPKSIAKAVELCRPIWMNDGFILIRWDVENDLIQCLFEVLPEITPTLFTKKLKGRLDHALRKLNTPVKFSRKVCLRSLGDNTREIVNNYVQKQVGKSDFIDARYKNFLSDFTVTGNIDLSDAMVLAHSRYWYNIHLVIVLGDRKTPMTQKETFELITDCIFKIANKKNCHIARLSVMPDHIHISLKGNPEMSPQEIGLSFMNNLAFLMRMGKFWAPEFYVGTFSEYSLEKITTSK